MIEYGGNKIMEYEKSLDVLGELFSKDFTFVLATVKDNLPSLRVVDTYYGNGAFWIVTYAKSNKVEEIENNPNVALCNNFHRFKGQAYKYVALNIAGLDLTTSTATEQLMLLGTFGISNWITGVVFILIGLKAKHISIHIIGLIPVAYGLSMIAIKMNMAGYAKTSADWGGMNMMVAYLIFCGITFIAGVSMIIVRNKKAAG
ncbi:MAG: pyridoxamine 5'-phosphate oxidase family protein [Firmicutes bacterium]|nr:pyridoxamine 5'-phosphate oxidase family protein [Bacillota bacterium]